MRRLLFIVLCTIFTLGSCKGPAQGPDPSPSQDVSPDPSSEEPSSEDPAPALLSGSFIQHWYVSSWTSTAWDTEMKVLSDAGIEYLIYSPLCSDGSEPAYSTLEACLKSAARFGVKVFVGPNSNSGWWDSSKSAAWLNDQMTRGVAIATEAYNRFHDKYPSSFYGWYWDWEVDNVSWTSRAKMLAKAWNITLDGLSGIDPSMPLLFSPFMNSAYGSAASYRDFWKDLFADLHLRKGDIFCPQDCVGAGGVPLTNSRGWFYQLAEAAKTVDGLQFWANVETFEQFNLSGGAHFATASLKRILQQMEAVKPFVSRIICFAYSHYLSPAQVREAYHDAYLEYLKTGSLPAVGTTGRVNSAMRSSSGSGVTLTWTMATKTDVDGFAIYKNGSLLVKCQIRGTSGSSGFSGSAGYSVPSTFTDPSGRASDTYEIASYNILGDESPKVAFK